MEASFCDRTGPIEGVCQGCRTALDCPGLAMDCDPGTHECTQLTTGNQAVVYGHTGTTLYRVDAVTKLVTAIANFQNCNSQVIDLALDRYSRAFVTTFAGFYRLDLATATCTPVSAGLGNWPNSLSFVPKGTLDPNAEALVGYQGSSYVRIDVTTGAIQQIGVLGGGFVSSGDIVSVSDGGTWLTAKGANGTAVADSLVEVDPSTGALVRDLGALPYPAVYGLAFWGGRLYGFSNAGTLFEITITGSSTTSAAVPNAMPQSWNGAGSTTAADLR